MGAAAEAAFSRSLWGARTEGSSSLLTLARPPAASGLTRAEGPWVRGPGRARGRVQQVEVPRTRPWGPVGVGSSAAQEGKRGRLRTSASIPGLIGAGAWGVSQSSPPPQSFPGVKTSRPSKGSSERDLAFPISRYLLRGEGVSRQGHEICLLGDLKPFSKVKSVGFKQRSHAVIRC